MINKASGEINMVCRQAQKRFASLDERSAGAGMSVTERAATERHLQTCTRCALEYRLFALQRAALDAVAAPEPITPDKDFFRALRARIARGPELSQSRRADESWAAALLLTARQLVPVMAVLLLVIIGATLMWRQPPSDNISQAAVRPRERVVFPDMYDYPAPTRDDVLETLVAAEEKENGK
ncbi:MAG: hypothetical protein AABN34_10005 [Acidobacteriota bacterium]